MFSFTCVKQSSICLQSWWKCLLTIFLEWTACVIRENWSLFPQANEFYYLVEFSPFVLSSLIFSTCTSISIQMNEFVFFFSPPVTSTWCSHCRDVARAVSAATVICVTSHSCSWLDFTAWQLLLFIPVPKPCLCSKSYRDPTPSPRFILFYEAFLYICIYYPKY